MPRTVSFEVPTDTAQFNFLQLQPKTLLNLSWSGYARWLREYAVAFPRLIREFGFGAVILEIDIEYLERLEFFDSDTLKISCGLRVLRGGSRLELVTDFSGAGRQAARATIILCPVEIKEQETLTAAPAKLSPALLEHFEADEKDEGSPKRRVPDLIKQIEDNGEELGMTTEEFFIHHHYCEVAEQWSFIEVPNIVESARESLALEHAAQHPAFRDSLTNPIGRINVELYQPYFVYEPGQVVTTAYEWDGRPAFVHRLKSERFPDNIYGAIIERF